MNKIKLREICKPNQIGKYGIPASAEDFTIDKTRYLRISDIDDNGNLLNNDKKSVSSQEIEKYILEEGDIVFARTGNSTGRTYYHENKNGILAYAGFLIKYGLDSKKVNPKYVKYFTTTQEYKQWVKNLSVGSTRGNINAQTFADCPIILPNRNQQDLLVSILSVLDDKIELNNSINAELEQMAKTLYDYWFLQFDFPNENSKPYKSSGGKMVYNEVLKREIPEGWKINFLSEINSELVRGISPKYSDSNGIPVINQRCIRNNTIDFSLCRLHNVQLKPVKKIIKIGDVLVNSTGVGTLGRVAIVKRLENPQTTVDSHVTIVRANINLVDPLFLGFSLVSKQVEIEKLGEGSTGQTELSRENLGKLPILLPKQNLQNDFASIIKPLFEKISNNEKQNLELASLRDWLLPMLMNGQVKVE
ncbi:type I restriction enzyme S subunit [Chryseobacterium bernardetii]|uniref:Type I restriction enzyme S subunit n=2 Tax=Chryseobacterium TaxID=59732 RepID=A0A543ELP7_9FLAO|nr:MULTISPECIES: restriction endonuclease subunit S [Chryseobacterium]MDR6368879.1 type I restriction enzyme S subunit [Chryseobacterium vietnamense]MDR6440198.1 type I restriction enzyme S subunit [Chryseobacterium bernardetii]TQM22490.1 type I restriction enzyme S subunit [Chryseobacterium aquifrigidense]